MLLAISMGLVATLYYQPLRLEDYLYSPWLLLTICIIWFVMLTMMHMHIVPFSLCGRQNSNAFFNWPKMNGAQGEQSSGKYEPTGGVSSDMELTRPHRRDSFYGQVGFDGSGYGRPNRSQTSYDPGLGLN